MVGLLGLSSRWKREGGREGGPARPGAWGERSCWGKCLNPGSQFFGYCGLGVCVCFSFFFFSPTPLVPFFFLPFRLPPSGRCSWGGSFSRFTPVFFCGRGEESGKREGRRKARGLGLFVLILAGTAFPRRSFLGSLSLSIAIVSCNTVQVSWRSGFVHLCQQLFF